MLLICAALATIFIIINQLNSDNKEKVMSDYCKIECKESILRQHKFCC
jgi:hypothetical protein